MTFREGGAFDYHTIFEQIKERIYHAVSIAQEEGRNIGSVGTLGDADLANIHLEQLPAYEPPPQVQSAEPVEEPGLASPGQHIIRDNGGASWNNSNQTKPEIDASTPHAEPPNEPPPGYEEAQAQAVGIDLDQRLREEAELGETIT